MTEPKKTVRKMTRIRIKGKLKKAVGILNEISVGQNKPGGNTKQETGAIPQALEMNVAISSPLTMWHPYCDTEQRPFGHATSDFNVADQACTDHMSENPGHVAEPIGSN